MLTKVLTKQVSLYVICKMLDIRRVRMYVYTVSKCVLQYLRTYVRTYVQ